MTPHSHPPEVNVSKCVGCGLCVRVCPSFVLDVSNAKALIAKSDWCIGCGHCAAICPMEALQVEGFSSEGRTKPGTSPATSPETLQLLLRERRSIRHYTKEPVPKALLTEVLEAGRYAPTGRNSQNVNYIVLISPERIEHLRRMTLAFYDKVFSRVKGRIGAFIFGLVAGRKIVESLQESLPKIEHARTLMAQGKDLLFYHAPVLVLVHAESWDTCSAFNGGTALYNCSLKAHTLGLGCCLNWYLAGAVNHDRTIKKWLGIPGDHKCYGTMTLGYPDIRFERLAEREPVKVQWL